MTLNIERSTYITKLEEQLKYFYEAKAIGDKEQIKYYQGYSKGMIQVMKDLGIIDDDELKALVKEAELDSPTILRKH